MTAKQDQFDQQQKTEAAEHKILRTRNTGYDLKNAEEPWKDLVDDAIIGVYRATSKGAFLLVNRKLAQIFGFDSPSEFLAVIPNISGFYQYLEERQLVLDKMEKDGFVYGTEVRATHKDGRAIWISISARKKEDKSGQTVHEGFVTDISDRKRADVSLQKNEEKFRLLVEQAGDSFFIHDEKLRIFDVNRQACETHGYSRDELLRMRISDIAVKMHRTIFENSLAPGEFLTFEGFHVRKDGSTFPTEVRLGRFNLGGQKLLLSLVRDTSERKHAEEKLKKAFQEIMQLKKSLEEENIHLREEIELTYRHGKIVGESAAIKKTLQEAEKVAKSETYVLIQGETGTGKELLARVIHNMSSRKGRSMITVNCAALPPTLIESELFGREKGAYTGALSKQLGRFEMANNSTLFLDEIGDLPHELQAKLLRVLQDGQFERLGSSETISVNVRVIAATNQDLAELVADKKFRSDLYYRLNVFPIVVPPLRERIDDIPLLVWAFVREFNQSMGKSIGNIPRKTMDRLQAHTWPGNIRELRNIIERAMILSSGPVLHIDGFEGQNTTMLEGVVLNTVDRNHILQTLQSTGWRVSGKKGAAQLLGLKESTLRTKMRKLGIKRPD
jgi:formate hydrogenlyase transcriptional activator